MPDSKAAQPKQRRFVPTLLVVLASILTFLAIISTWVRQEALDTDQWVKTSSTIIKQKSVQQETASYLAEQLQAAKPAEGLVELLPDKAQPLAVPLRGLAGDVAERTALRLLARQEFHTIWEEANRFSHAQLVRTVNSDRNQAVALDLRPMLGRIAQRTGFGLDPAQQSRGVITIIEADQLDQLRTAAKLLRAAAWWTAALALAAFAAAIALAGDRRRTVVKAGFGLLLVGLLTLVTRRLGISEATAALTPDGGSQAAARDSLLVATQLIQDFARMVVALGVMTLLSGWILGPSALATRLRGWASPVLKSSPGVVHAVMFGIVLWVLYLGLLPWSSNVVAVVVYVILGALLVESLRRETLGHVDDSAAASADGG